MYLLAPALVLLAGLILIVRLQTLSPPVRVEPYALWHRTQELLEQPVPACVSAEAGRPWIALGAPLGLFLGFVAAFVNATDRARDRCLGSRLCRIWHVRPHLDPPSLIWAEKQVFSQASRGLVNRNTAATYFGTGAVVWLLITLEAIQGRLPQGALNWFNFGSAILDGRSPKLIAALSCLLCLRGPGSTSLATCTDALINLSRQPISLGMTILVAHYVDRGPEPKSVIDYLASDQFFPTPTIALRGNHDEVLLAFLADPRTGDLWRRMGGVETHCTPTEVNVADFRQGKDLD